MEYFGLNAEHFLAFCHNKLVNMHINGIYSNALTMAVYGDSALDGIKAEICCSFLLKCLY